MKMIRVTIPGNDGPELFTPKGYTALVRRLNDWRIAIETAEEIEVFVQEEADGNCQPGDCTRSTVSVQAAEAIGKVQAETGQP